AACQLRLLLDACGVYPLDAKRYLHFAGALKAQRHRDFFAFLERSLDIDEHQVGDAGLELQAAPGREVVAFDRPHAHHVAVVEMHMHLDSRRERRGRANQVIRRGRLVADRQVAGRGLCTRRRCPRPGILDFNLSQRRARQQSEQKQGMSHFRFSFSCSSRHRIFPVAVLGSSATNSTTRGTLNAAMWARAHSMMSSARSSPIAPGLGTITAFPVSPTSPAPNSARLSGSRTRASVLKIGMPPHWRLGRCGGLMCGGAMVSDSPYPST